MQARLKTSLKRTDFPKDYIKLIKDVISKNFKKYLKDKTIAVEGYIYLEEILVRISFKNNNSPVQRNFDCSVNYSAKDKNAMDMINLSMDALGSMIEQYFKSDGDIELPVTWEKFDLDGKAIYLKTSTENPELEAMADKILSESE